MAVGLNYVSLPRTTGRYVRFTLTVNTGTDNRITDIQVFGYGPVQPLAGTVIIIN